MKKRNVARFTVAAAGIFVMVSVCAAFSPGQDAQKAEPRTNAVGAPVAGEGMTAQDSVTVALPAETSGLDMPPPNTRRVLTRNSDRKNASPAGRNRRTSVPSDADKSSTSTTVAASDHPSRASVSLPLVSDTGAVPMSSDVAVPPALADTPGIESPPGNSTPANSTDTVSAKAPQIQQVEHTDVAPAGPDMSLLKAAGGFGLVLSLIALGYFGARKFFPQHFNRRTSDRNLKLIETLTVGEKRSIAIIEFDKQRFLIGNTPNQITLLAALAGKVALVEESRPASVPLTELSKPKVTSDSFRSLYEVEKTNGVGHRKPLPPDIRAKMRQLRESLET